MSNLATIVNNILADSGIDDINVVVTTGSYSNPAWITALSWTKITERPTTLAGYGITDAYTQTQVNNLLAAKQNTLTLTTTGTSGVATLIGATLNIPDYGGALGAYLPLVGGTMTGNINWAQTDRGIVWSFNTDGASIKFYNTGDSDTDSRLEFATVDNNNEYFRWGHIPSGGSFYESMRLLPNSSNNAQLIISGEFSARKNSGNTDPESNIGVYSTFLNTSSTNGTGSGISVGSNNNSGGTIYAQLVNSTTNEHVLGFQVRNSSSSSTTRMLINGAGNLGLGTTIDSWASGWRALQVGAGSAIAWTGAGANDFSFSTNSFFDSVDNRWEYRSTGDGAARYSMTALSSEHRWFVAPIGTANQPITFTQAMTLFGTGNLLVGSPSPISDNGARLQVIGVAGNQSPFVTFISTSSNNVFNWVSTAFASNLAASNNLVHFIGQSGSAKNGAYFGFKYNGSGSNNNILTLGLFAVDNILNINGLGNVGIATETPNYRLHVVTDAVAGRQNMSNISRTSGNWVRFTNPQYSTDASMGLILRVFPDSDLRQGAGIIASGGSNNACTNLDLFVTTSPDGLGGTSYSALNLNGFSGAATFSSDINTTNGAVTIKTAAFGGLLNLQSGTTTDNWQLYHYSIDNTLRFNYNGAGADEFILTTSGDVSFTGSVTTTSLLTTSMSGSAINIRGNATLNSPFGITWTTPTYTGGLAAIRVQRTGAADASDMIFYTSPNGDIPNERVRIDSNGLVTIGTGATTGTTELLRLRRNAGGWGNTTFKQSYNSTYFTNGKTLTLANDSNTDFAHFAGNNAGTRTDFYLPTGVAAIGTASPQSGVTLDVRGGGAVATAEGLRLGNVGDNTAYDNVRMYYTGFNSGAPRIYLTPRTTPGSGTVNTYLHLQNTNGTSTTSNNTMGLIVDGTIQGGGNFELVNAGGPYFLIGESTGANGYGTIEWNAANNRVQIATQPFAFGAGGGQINLHTSGNVSIGTLSDNGFKFFVSGNARIANTAQANDFIASTDGLNVGNYNFYSQTISGAMGILGHNVRASGSVANQVNVVNGGWISSMIRQYYSEGIAFHTSPTMYAAGDIYPMAATERMRINSLGAISMSSLAGSGSRIVVANSGGTLISAVIGSGLAFDGTTLTATGGSSGSISGGGTSGIIPVFTGASSIGNSVITQSSSNIGIGASSVTASRLRVEGSTSEGTSVADFISNDTTASAVYHRGIRVLAPSLPVGDKILMSVGVADNTRNMGQLYFNYVGSGSTSNFLSLGLFAVDEVLNIMGTGNVCVGITSDNGYKFRVRATDANLINATTSGTNVRINLGHSANGGFIGYINQGSGAQGNVFYVTTGAGTVGSGITMDNNGAVIVSSSVTATSFFESSDSRIKTLLEDKLDYQAISSVTARYYEKNGKIELGYFAQDFEALLPSAVSKNEDGYLNLSYREVHTAKIAYLEKRINELEQQLKNK